MVLVCAEAKRLLFILFRRRLYTAVKIKPPPLKYRIAISDDSQVWPSHPEMPEPTLIFSPRRSRGTGGAQLFLLPIANWRLPIDCETAGYSVLTVIQAERIGNWQSTIGNVLHRQTAINLDHLTRDVARVVG
jgi:hypothetical protein